MRTRAALGSVLFFVVAPGVVAGLIPWWLTGWHPRPGPWPLRALGLVLLVAGTAFLVTAFVRFVVEGLGTPAPVAPPQRLVVGGIYRYVRNPMYLAVLACVLGQYLLLFQPVLLIDLLLTGVAVVAFVHLYEEPTLAAQSGEEYAAYRRAVPGWWPRLRPYRSGTAEPRR
jgi:protein-S-isoprenylcysteine O-methyltransferase Ste14